MKTTGTDRLERLIAHRGLCSRREAKNAIVNGYVQVNGTTITIPGTLTPVNAEIAIQNSLSRETVLLYKPAGIETSKTTPSSIDVHTKFPQFSHLSPIGRLDKASEGLLLLSNDGRLTRLMTAQKKIPKTYLVTVQESVTPQHIQRLLQPMRIGDAKGPVQAIAASRTSPHEVTITITEGRKHQVRRMCNNVSLTVNKLTRIAIGVFTIDQLNTKPFIRIKNDTIEQMVNID